MRKLVYRSALGAAALGLCVGLSSVKAQTATLGVSAFVGATCTLTAGTPIAFGNIATSYTTAPAATGSISVNCPLLQTVNIAIDNGVNASGAQRRMTDGATHYINYNVYQDLLHTTAWGSTTGTNTEIFVGTGLTVPVNVYGQVPTGQTLTTGSYTDTLTVSLIY